MTHAVFPDRYLGAAVCNSSNLEWFVFADRLINPPLASPSGVVAWETDFGMEKQLLGGTGLAFRLACVMVR